jgi:hypothetical protein
MDPGDALCPTCPPPSHQRGQRAIHRCTTSCRRWLAWTWSMTRASPSTNTCRTVPQVLPCLLPFIHLSIHPSYLIVSYRTGHVRVTVSGLVDLRPQSSVRLLDILLVRQHLHLEQSASLSWLVHLSVQTPLRRGGGRGPLGYPLFPSLLSSLLSYFSSLLPSFLLLFSSILSSIPPSLLFPAFSSFFFPPFLSLP